MKVALVHDYIKEYGGAERVLEALVELYPDAPIYTAFYNKDSLAYQKFKERTIHPSWVHYIPFFSTYLHSPLRFLAPLIWSSFDFSSYDVVISSASWYVTKGFGKKKAKPIEVCYCHTPPRWLYGYKTSIEFQKYWPVRIYAAIVGHFMRMYDFSSAQKVHYFIANSKETESRIQKFYRRDATVVYPPVSLPLESTLPAGRQGIMNPPAIAFAKRWRAGHESSKKKDYFFVLARIVGGKGLDLAVETASKMGFPLKIAGVPAGYYTEHEKLQKIAKDNVEFLGYVSDEQLVKLYSEAKAFLALATDEDFGITPVESMLCGTPVIAYHGGGYKETVIEGETGIFFDTVAVGSLALAINKFNTVKWDKKVIQKHAEQFSKERFQKEIKEFVEKVTQ